MSDVSAAVNAIDRGELVIYPTETVYGLGGNALDEQAIERVFAAKSRPSSNPMALAVADIAVIPTYVKLDELTRKFIREFLPGPVTVICPRRTKVPAALSAGRDHVGVRVPDHDLAREFLSRTPAVTATSANVSGTPPARELEAVDADIRAAATVELDGGETAGGVSTVVDISEGEIYRHGRMGDRVNQWLDDRGLLD